MANDQRPLCGEGCSWTCSSRMQIPSHYSSANQGTGLYFCLSPGLSIFIKCFTRVPALCGATPADSSYIGEAGDKVAARVKSADGEENWILAEIVQFLSSSNKYEVDDIDAEEGKEWAFFAISLHLFNFLKISPFDWINQQCSQLPKFIGRQVGVCQTWLSITLFSCSF